MEATVRCNIGGTKWIQDFDTCREAIKYARETANDCKGMGVNITVTTYKPKINACFVQTITDDTDSTSILLFRWVKA